ncbi:MAG TPA: hypothetical protein VLX30_07570 [Burkholderiales bacterium]|nr:hypothetical protein [Burkholderiales bacterium]
MAGSVQAAAHFGEGALDDGIYRALHPVRVLAGFERERPAEWARRELPAERDIGRAQRSRRTGLWFGARRERDE